MRSVWAKSCRRGCFGSMGDLKQFLCLNPMGWLAGWLAGWLVGWLVGVGGWVGRVAGWFAGQLAGWSFVYLSVCLRMFSRFVFYLFGSLFVC